MITAQLQKILVDSARYHSCPKQGSAQVQYDKICEILSQLGINVEELEFKSKRSCQKCVRQIFSSYKFCLI